MPAVLAVDWWAIALRGVIAIFFAILTFSMPGITIAVLVILFGAYALVDGVFAIISAVRAAQGHRHWGAFLAEGVIGILLGITAFAAPGAFAASVIYLIAAWAIITGVLEIAAAIRLRKIIAGEWLLILTGVVSIGFGVFSLWAPAFGALAIVLWIGAYAFVFGVLLLGVAFRLRAATRAHTYLSNPSQAR